MAHPAVQQGVHPLAMMDPATGAQQRREQDQVLHRRYRVAHQAIHQCGTARALSECDSDGGQFVCCGSDDGCNCIGIAIKTRDTRPFASGQAVAGQVKSQNGVTAFKEVANDMAIQTDVVVLAVYHQYRFPGICWQPVLHSQL